MRAAILTTAFVIGALALWANLREPSSRIAFASSVLPDVAAAPPREPSAPPTETAAPEPTYEPASAVPAAREHIVAAGETLADLALHYYGDARRAAEIYAANRDQIRDPEQLHAGQALVIP
jgi:nucleoid-associated protein YgaU